MTDRPDYFSRIIGRVDLDALSDTFVVIAGVGSVGSMIALELARCGVGHLALLDGDHLEGANLSRHALADAYVGTNKAEAMASHLALNIPGLDVAGAPFHLDDSFSDAEIDRCLARADLVVIATDQRAAQRRIARRALAMDIPAVLPGLYADRGGEVFVQLNPGQACFMCWDAFREEDAQVRGVSSLNADALSVIQQAVYLCLAVLDPRSRHARDLAPLPQDPRPRQLFVQRPGAALVRASVTRRADCPGCAVGPSPLAGAAHAGEATTELFDGLLVGHERMLAAGWRFALSGEIKPPRIDAVEVSEPLVVEGTTVTLSWAASNATHVRIDGLGTHPSEGAIKALVANTTAFRVHAVNPFGEDSALSPVVRTMRLPRLREIALPTLPTVEAPDPRESMAHATASRTATTAAHTLAARAAARLRRAHRGAPQRGEDRGPRLRNRSLLGPDTSLPMMPQLPQIFGSDLRFELDTATSSDIDNEQERGNG
jgi:molybdopterin/thiamine biosynthesis adenylyltransferase